MKISLYIIRTLVKILPFLIEKAGKETLGYSEANKLRLARFMLIKLKRLIEKRG